MGSDAPPVLTGVALRREGSSSLSGSPVFLRMRIQYSDGSERDTDIEITDQVEFLRSLLSWCGDLVAVPLIGGRGSGVQWGSPR